MSIQPDELEHLRKLYKKGEGDISSSSRKSKTNWRQKFTSKKRTKLSRRWSISSVTSNSTGGSRIVPAITIERGYLSGGDGDSIYSAVSSSVAGVIPNGIEMTDFRKIEMISHSDLKEKLRQLNTSAEEDSNDVDISSHKRSLAHDTHRLSSEVAHLSPDYTDGCLKLNASVQTSMTGISCVLILL